MSLPEHSKTEDGLLWDDLVSHRRGRREEVVFPWFPVR
jgi:hypothetical protein